MAAFSRTLAHYVLWRDIARLVRPDTAENDCLLCDHRAFTVLEDDALGAEWCYCTSCGFAGDPIELASRLLRLDIAETLQELHNRGLSMPTTARQPSGIERYIKDHVQRRLRIRDFWKRIQSDLPYYE